MKKENILVFCSHSDDQILGPGAALAKYAKKAGYYVITCDYLPDNPGHKFSDAYYNISTTEKEKVMSLAEKLNVDAIVPYGTEPGSPTAAFISNRNEERKLRSHKHQRALAKAIFKGTRSYFRSNPVPGTLLAVRDRRHRIARGETLSGIAQRYQISLASIRGANNIHGDKLRIGKMLSIPAI